MGDGVKAIRRALPTLFLTGLVFYFGYHGLSGDQGVLAWAGYQAKVVELEDELALAEAERIALERRAERLREGSLDLDLLDERSRDILNFAHPDDFVVRVNDNGSYTN